MFGLIILTAAVVGQGGPGTAASFSPSELRTMCRGETDERAEFRTEAAFRVLASHQRSKCRMYLLGLVDGLVASSRPGDRLFCSPADFDRERMADRLMDSVLSDAADQEPNIPALVQNVLRAESRCR